ncbi:hypothetical protein [Chryseobacterium taeanense]|uniref:hypothetical protein n=1 Tax=Chryseobacterium taeanense TaxID=311334 RepID=UPI0035ADE750
MKTKKTITFYLVSFITIALILLSSNTGYYTDETRFLDKIISFIVFLNLIIYTASLKADVKKNYILLFLISVIIFIYVILSVSYEDEMETYLYRVLCILNINIISNKSLSAIIQNFWFISFFLTVILEFIFVIKMIYTKITQKKY